MDGGFKILNFTFWGVSGRLIFWGYEDFVDIGGTSFRGHFRVIS